MAGIEPQTTWGRRPGSETGHAHSSPVTYATGPRGQARILYFIWHKHMRRLHDIFFHWNSNKILSLFIKWWNLQWECYLKWSICKHHRFQNKNINTMEVNTMDSPSNGMSKNTDAGLWWRDRRMAWRNCNTHLYIHIALLGCTNSVTKKNRKCLKRMHICMLYRPKPYIVVTQHNG